MQIAGIMNTAREGMATETARIERAARNIAGAASPAASDPAQDVLDLVFAETGFRANAAVFETGADLWEVLATIKRD
ncbi:MULTISPECIES: flagellar basal body rod protein [unclassified Shinella]|uniref:flagellar basal body rod protein n=1 Tax=unclassified Shinella TaxID=2643062 RepID=UPI00102D613A|nr:flagellar basal body rod protein [Shinella sp. JR1-6]TAA57479.1 flagellar basal body rod protein [Shinella sp. JR1-6]